MQMQKQMQKQSKSKCYGFVVGVAAEFPPIAKSAMDGAPERLWARLRI
jgi:hypothetical protein